MENINEDITKDELVHNESLDRRKVKIITLVSFIMGFSQAIFAYVMSSYFREASGTENVGVFYFLAYVVVLIVLLNLHKLIRKIGKARVFLISILAKIAIIFALTVLAPSLTSAVFLMGYIILGALVWVDLDVMLESFSRDNMSGRIRGAYLTIVNVGYLIAPFLATRVLERFNYYGIFFLLLILNSIVFIIALAGLKNVNHKFDQREKVCELMKKISKRPNVKRIYLVSFALEFFYALMVIYTPIYLIDKGVTWDQIGVIFTIMLIPFVILQYPAGRLADKKIGEKELLIFSLIIMGATTGALFFIQSNSVWLWASLLFATRIGAALIEILRDSYFYKRIDGHDVDIINFFRTSSATAFLVATSISIPLLLIFPVKWIFLLVAVVVLFALIPAFGLEDNKSEDEVARFGG
jgi:MFS family permease